MKLHPRVTQTAVDLAKRFEGFRPRAGKTPDDRYTIGYGHILGSRDKPDEVEISEAEAEFLLKLDLSRVAEEIEPALMAPVNDNQFAALLSFAFNIGTDNFKGSSALRRLNEGAYLQAAAALELWRRADFDGETLVVDQLVRRRAVEKALFLAPPEGFTPVPSAVLRPTFDHSVIGAAVAWAAARERTAVSRLALEGPDVSAGLAIPPGREGEPAPSAAIAAADALTVRLSRILPETIQEPEDAPAPEPLSLQSETAPAEPSPPAPPTASALDLQAPPPPTEENPAAATPNVDAAPQEPAPSFGRPFAALSSARPAAPAAKGPPAFLRESFVAASPPSAAAEAAAPQPPSFDDPIFSTPVDGAAVEEAPTSTLAESAMDAPPPVDAPEAAESVDASPFRRRFGSRITNALQQADSAPESAFAPAAETPSLFDAPARSFVSDEPATPLAATAEPSTPSEPLTPLFERPIFFVALGLLGVALFAGSIFCMLNKASFTCLLIGVVGVLAMAPAAAFFLFRFLGSPVDHTHGDHADMISMMAEPAPPPLAEPVAEDDTNAPSAFDRADWR